MPTSRTRASRPGRGEATASTLDRYRGADAYRARREWQRYSGTGQRDLFRELRERFLARHAVEEGWVVDVGSGPGRFLAFIGGPRTRKVALDVSAEMLSLLPRTWPEGERRGAMPDRVRADAVRPPFAKGTFSEVVVMGNTLGFAGRFAGRLLEEAEQLVRPSGVLVVEIAPASGERSQYLGRLPASSLARLFRSPLAAILGRLDREPFRREPPRHATPRTFRRMAAEELGERLRAGGWEVREMMAVAPALGPDAERIAALRPDPKSWGRLLDLEEEVGHRPGRWPEAAAVLVGARRPSSNQHD